MNDLFFLDPTPRAVLGLPALLRRSVYERLAELLQNARRDLHFPDAERLTDHVCISRIDSPQNPALRIAFAKLKGQLVILQISHHLRDFRKEQLETDVDILSHVDLSKLGLRIEARPDEPDIASWLDSAVKLYCRVEHDTSGDRIRANTPHLRDSAVLDIVRRLTVSHGPAWTSSEARQQFKDVLDRAERDPQLIERGDRRFMIVDESRLPTLIGRKNAAEMYRYFFEDSEPIEPFERVPGTPPGRLLDLT